MKGSYIDYAYLVGVSALESCNILKVLPSHGVSKDFELICINSLVKKKTPFVYCYSLYDNKIAYAYAFTCESKYYSIIISTDKILPSLYTEFLNDCIKLFESPEIVVTPERRLEYIYSTIKSWKIEPVYGENVVFSATSSYKIDKSVTEYTAYNPFCHFKDVDNINNSWKNLLLGAGVLVVSNDPTDLYMGVFSIASITSPIPFRGKILITTSPFDTRLADLDEYEIVGIMKDSVKEVKRKFGITLKTISSTTDFSGARAGLFERSRKQKNVFLYLMDRILNLNPFNDLLNGPWIPDSLEKEMEKAKNKVMLKAFQIRLAEKTATVRQFRYDKRFRDSFRNAFLSSEPEDVCKELSREHLKQMIPILNEIAEHEEYKNDKHMHAVIKKYRKIIYSQIEVKE